MSASSTHEPWSYLASHLSSDVLHKYSLGCARSAGSCTMDSAASSREPISDPIISFWYYEIYMRLYWNIKHMLNFCTGSSRVPIMMLRSPGTSHILTDWLMIASAADTNLVSPYSIYHIDTVWRIWSHTWGIYFLNLSRSYYVLRIRYYVHKPL